MLPMAGTHRLRSQTTVAVLPMGAWLCIAANPAMLTLLVATLAAGLDGGAAAAGVGAAGLGWAAFAVGVAAVAAAGKLAIAFVAAGRLNRLTCDYTTVAHVCAQS